MRALTFLALMALMSVSLSGCLGFGDDDPEDEEHEDDHDHCDPADAQNYTPEDCPDTGDGDGNETQEPPAPNQLPEAVLTMTGPDGTLNGTSYVLPGDNVTFSAVGSGDPDGEVALVGLTIEDSNGTRTAQLFDAATGAYSNATFTFDSVGPVNVTIRVLDDNGEGVIRVGFFAVNDPITATEEFSAGAPTGSASACEAPGAGSSVPPLVTNNYAKRSMFSVQRGAQWIEASVASGSAEIAICAPDGTALSGGGTEVQTEDTNGTLAVNAQYYVMVLSESNSGGDVGLDILVHYEPKP